MLRICWRGHERAGAHVRPTCWVQAEEVARNVVVAAQCVAARVAVAYCS